MSRVSPHTVPLTKPAARPPVLQNEPLAGSLPKWRRLSSKLRLVSAGVLASAFTCWKLTPVSMTPMPISGRSSGRKLTCPCTRTAPLATRTSACPAVTGASRSSSATPAGTASSKAAACAPLGDCNRPRLLSMRTRVSVVTG